MAKHIVIDWQRDSLLAAVVSGHGARGSLAQTFEEEINTSIGDGLAQAVLKASGELKLGKAAVTAVVSREFAEVRTIQVPKVDASELPDIIRFQAQRKFANLADNSIVDFVMLPERPGQEMATALVGGIAADTQSAVESACSAANLQLQHLALRPIEIARFATQSGKLKTTCASMIICIAQDCVDLLTLLDGQLVQVRSTKLASDHNQLGQAIKGEIRRSLMAAAGELCEKSLEQVIVITSGPLDQELETAISDASDAPIVSLDITESVSSGADAEFTDKHAPRLAAILGASSLGSEDRSAVIDFQNPKKRPPKERNTRTWILAASAAVLLIGAGLSWIYLKQKALGEELTQLQAEINDAEKTVELSEAKIKQWNQIEAFLKASPNWLDELAYISENIPEGDRIVVQNPVFNVNRDGSATIQITSVRASDSSAISAFEESLRSENYKVKGSEARQLSSSDYPWQASETITIQGKGWSYDSIEAAMSKVAKEAEAPEGEAAEKTGEPEEGSSSEPVKTSAEEPSPEKPVAKVEEEPVAVTQESTEPVSKPDTPDTEKSEQDSSDAEETEVESEAPSTELLTEESNK